MDDKNPKDWFQEHVMIQISDLKESMFRLHEKIDKVRENHWLLYGKITGISAVIALAVRFIGK